MGYLYGNETELHSVTSAHQKQPKAPAASDRFIPRTDSHCMSLKSSNLDTVSGKPNSCSTLPANSSLFSH